MTPDTHRHFHEDLSQVKERLLSMSGEAEAALGFAVDALLERDLVKASAASASPDIESRRSLTWLRSS